MVFSDNSEVFKGAQLEMRMMGVRLPYLYTDQKDEYLAGRRSAWLGLTLNVTPVYELTGKDVPDFLTHLCVNRDFSLMKTGQSKHALICNDDGILLADGVIMKVDEGRFRTYWLAPVLQYYAENCGMDVHGEYIVDEYFFQIDGPRSLEILEEACETNLHDLHFGNNKTVKICGTDMLVQRLGMSGCLAYEVHGKAENGEKVYHRLREIVEKYDGRAQGIGSYGIINHTVAGYPNMYQHFAYPCFEEPGLKDFMEKAGGVRVMFCGSASDNPSLFYVTPYDVGWNRMINYNHDFRGKEALLKIKENPPRRCVTLEWNADDIADVFASSFRGRDVVPYDNIEQYTDGNMSSFRMRGDYVTKDGKKIGMAIGRTWAFYEQRMVSLAYIDPQYAEPGNDLVIQWGDIGHPVKEIRAKTAHFPYYNGKYRNETFDVSEIPSKY